VKKAINSYIHSIFDRIEMSQELIVLVGMQGPMQSFEHRISTISSAYLSGGSSQKALESWQKRNIFRSYLRARNGVVSS